MSQERHVRPHHHHLAQAARVQTWSEVKAMAADVHGLNGKIAIAVTAFLGSMVAFWIFSGLAFISLPAILVAAGVLPAHLFPATLLKASVIGLVAWIAQTYIQLVALAVLQVSGNAQGSALAANTTTILADAEQTREHTTLILNLLDEKTEGGLKVVLDAIHALNGKGEASG